MNYYPLPTKYLEILETSEAFKLTIMGKDPYPQCPVGIPFCKPEWDQLNDDQCSGHHVLLSLGVNLMAVRKEFVVPVDYFCYLAKEKGIAFLNLSYHLLDGPCRKGKHKEQLLAALETNGPVLSKSKHVVLCGEAKKHNWYGLKLSQANEVVHPDVRCRISNVPGVANEWQDWWSPNAIAEILGVEV